MKIKRFSNSFVTLCLIQFLIYGLIVLGVCLLFNRLVTVRLDNSFKVIDDILEYEGMLESENYDAIPIKSMPNCDFAIYDENDEVIYSTDEKLSDMIDASDLEFISDYSNQYYYYIFSGSDKEGNTYYKVYQNVYDIENDTDVINGYAKLDDNLSVVEGNLFEKDVTITEKQFNLIKGNYKSNKSIEKYVYENDEGSLRTLVFISPNITTATYDIAVSDSQSLWWFAVPVVIFLMIIETIIFNKRIRKNLNILNDAIATYKSGSKLDVDKSILPQEFSEIVDSFDNLMERLKRSEEQRQQIYQDKQRMIVDVSHDLKTPLTVIQGYSKAFLDDMVPDEKRDTYLRYIYNKSVIAVELIDGLFEYARMEHPEYKLNFKDVDIVEITKLYLAEKYSEIEMNGMSIDIDLPDKKILANLDVLYFRRVYENLINNSIKYNKEGTKIYFKLWDNKDYIFISIGDNGVGVTDEIKENIFDPFITSNKARTSGKGTGLGMAIVKRIVELHNGRIEFVKKPRSGLKTEFNIIIEK